VTYTRAWGPHFRNRRSSASRNIYQLLPIRDRPPLVMGTPRRSFAGYDPESMFPVAIRGESIELREMEPEDVPSIAEIIADEAVLRYTTWKGATDPEAAEGFVRMAQETAAATPRIEYLLTIAYLPSGEVIGTGGIRQEDDAGEMGSLRCLLRRDWWGRGVASEAAILALRFGFETLGLQRIEADPALDNVAAVRLLEKVGMRRLEVQPEHHLPPGGVVRDSVRFAMAREEFRPRNIP
jgi:RimJ/RimL family protein N-acetyltransferase